MAGKISTKYDKYTVISRHNDELENVLNYKTQLLSVMFGCRGDYTCRSYGGGGDYTRGWVISTGGTMHGREGGLYTGVGGGTYLPGGLYMDERGDYTRGCVGDIYRGLCMEGRGDYTRGSVGDIYRGDYAWRGGGTIHGGG